MYQRLISLASFFGIFLLLANALASFFYWYSSMPSFDMFMHAVGGVFVALLGAVIFMKQTNSLPNREKLITLLLFVFIVGLGWEYYEYIVQIYIKEVKLADIPDSISDLLCDLFGGLIGIYLVILVKKSYNRKNEITTRT